MAASEPDLNVCRVNPYAEFQGAHRAVSEKASTKSLVANFEVLEGRLLSDAPDWLHRNVAGALGAMSTDTYKRISNEVDKHLLEGNYEDAAAALAEFMEDDSSLFLKPQTLLNKFRLISIETLSEIPLIRFRRARISCAISSDAFDVAAIDARHLLTGADSAKEANWLRMIIAISAARQGKRASALSEFRQIAESSGCDAIDGAWAYRNMAMLVPLEDERCEQYSRRSSDLFLVAGDRHQAASSLVHATRSRLMRAPSTAHELLSEPLAWFSGEDLGDRHVRGGMLQNRSRASLLCGQWRSAFDDARASVACLDGISGSEQELMQSLAIAIESGRRLGEEVQDMDTRYEVLASTALGVEYKIRQQLSRLIEKYSSAEAAALHDSSEIRQRPHLHALLLIADVYGQRETTHVTRLGILESALELARKARNEHVETSALMAIAVELHESGNKEESFVYFKEVVQREPTNRLARQYVVDLLQKLEKHDEGVRFMEDQIRLWGPLPGLRFMHARFLFSKEQLDLAANIFASIAASSTVPDEIRSAASTWRDKTLNGGGRLSRTVLAETREAVERSQLEEALARFTEMIKSQKRMSFWRPIPKGGGARQWIERPESHAKHLLHSYLSGAFGDLIEVFEEVAVGAGRIDLRVALAGGLVAIVELKMLGSPSYDSNYALNGEGQIGHYMDNSRCHLGYLVIFDARSQTWGNLEIGDAGHNTISRIFVDVRPDIPSKCSRRRKKGAE